MQDSQPGQPEFKPRSSTVRGVDSKSIELDFHLLSPGRFFAGHLPFLRKKKSVVLGFPTHCYALSLHDAHVLATVCWEGH